jgi:2,5-diamino-6-(ribosylamino)-4(3H)-pyrimidinone 5'-phosphate reductase
MSLSADGKIATANRRVSTFSSRRDHDHLLELRATADAVMCGARTADLNEINLGPGSLKHRRLRLRRGLGEYNLRIIVSGTGTLAPESAVFKHRFSPVIVLTTGRAPARRLERLRAVADEVRVGGDREIDWPATLRWLRSRWHVKRLLCEGGGELNDALFRAGVVDELHLTFCPRILGGRRAPTIADGRGFPRLADAAPFRLVKQRLVAGECFAVFRRV